MRLYQEIIFLKHHYGGKWIVENVRPYYKPLIPPSIVLQRHLFWCNFDIKDKYFNSDSIRTGNTDSLSKIHGFDLSKYKIKNKRQILRNCVNADLGLHILSSS